MAISARRPYFNQFTPQVVELPKPAPSYKQAAQNLLMIVNTLKLDLYEQAVYLYLLGQPVMPFTEGYKTLAECAGGMSSSKATTVVNSLVKKQLLWTEMPVGSRSYHIHLSQKTMALLERMEQRQG